MKDLVTVTGTISPDQCGMILSHEHFFIDLQNQASVGAETRKISRSDRKRLLSDPYCMKDDLLLDSLELAAEEAGSLLKWGCNTVIDCTLSDIGRDPRKLRKLSESTGLNIIMGCGWYTGDTHPPDFLQKNTADLAEELIFEIRNGVNGSGICPGIIGEIGTGKEISAGEWNALEAAAEAQKKTGLAIQIHIYPWSRNGLAVVQKLTSLGVQPDRIVICHSDVQLNWDYIRELLMSGVFVELDNFGKEFVPEVNGFAGGDFATDRERAMLAAKIISEGFGSQLLLTNDICLKCMLSRYGGNGYTHIFRNILPMISEYGISENYLRDTVMRENPLHMLTGEKTGDPGVFSDVIIETRRFQNSDPLHCGDLDRMPNMEEHAEYNNMLWDDVRSFRLEKNQERK